MKEKFHFLDLRPAKRGIKRAHNSWSGRNRRYVYEGVDGTIGAGLRVASQMRKTFEKNFNGHRVKGERGKKMGKGV